MGGKKKQEAYSVFSHHQPVQKYLLAVVNLERWLGIVIKKTFVQLYVINNNSNNCHFSSSLCQAVVLEFYLFVNTTNIKYKSCAKHHSRHKEYICDCKQRTVLPWRYIIVGVLNGK